jgi:hypothetical protein
MPGQAAEARLDAFACGELRYSIAETVSTGLTAGVELFGLLTDLLPAADFFFAGDSLRAAAPALRYTLQ